MKKMISVAALAAATVVWAEAASYNDLGGLAGQTGATSDGFWDTTGRSAISIERTASSSNASGFDSFTCTFDESDSAINVVRTRFGMLLIVL